VLARIETKPAVSARSFFVCATLLLLLANGASGARYQRTQDGKTLIWNNVRGVAQDVTWSGGRDSDGYATGQGTLTWYRLGKFVNSYTGRMVHGKFDGPVIREQGQTRLQTTFVNGEKIGDWSEPGSTRTPAPKPKTRSTAAEAQPTEEPIVERPSPTPSPSPLRSPSPSPRPTLTPLPALSPSATRSPTPTATSTPRPTPTPTPISTPTPLRSSMPSPVETAPQPGSSPPSPPSPTSPIAQSASPAASPPRVLSTEKRRLIEELRKQTEAVLAQVRDATGNFREIDRLEAVQNLPAPVSASVTVLGTRARDFRTKVGYEVAAYECLAEMEAVEALVLVDETARDITAKDVPAARRKLSGFLKRYHEPTADNQKPLSRYLTSVLSLCDRSKNEAETHLKRAQSLDSAGKKSEALREYQEIYRIYPNPITADKIRQLEAQSR
jgi:hypothetical protein